MSSGSSPGSSGSTSSSTARDRSVLLSDLLEHIHVHYKAALDRLPVEELPVLIPRLLEHGVCVGLLDPVSNIIANTVCSCYPLPETNAAAQDNEEKSRRRGRKRKRIKKAAAENARRRKRDEVMSEIATDTSNIVYLPPILKGPVGKRTVAQRSLEGLVTFLICYFRRLPVLEALHYLVLAKADLLAAVHLVDCSRGMRDRVCPTSTPTTLIALRCAAISASHPEPAILAARSLALASHHEQVSQLLTVGHCLSSDAINRLHKLLQEPLEQRGDSPEVWQSTLCSSRDIKGTNCVIEFPLESKDTLRYLLLEKIHVLYLKAIAQLQTDALRRRHHRGLLKAGLCFGPAGDPVSNIILNTIWYDTMFPTNVEFEVDMIGIESLMRIGCHSLNGLLAFLHKLFPALSEHDAMLYLFRTNVSLQEVISRVSQGHHLSSSYEDAYKAAADTACHPHPDAHAEFTMSTCPDLASIVRLLQGLSCTLTYSEVELITGYFSLKSCPGKSVCVPKLAPMAAKIISHHRQKFMANQHFISTKVNAALQRYGKEKGTEFELHVICGMNSDVPENGKHAYKYIHSGAPYAHVNFLARPKGSHPDDTAPSLFFLECSNDKEDQDGVSLCCTVLSSVDSGRCFHCEYEGKKIVHPAVETYRGRETDFEEMAWGQRNVDNEDLIGFGELSMEHAGLLGDDSAYFDPAVDSDFAESMNYFAMWKEKVKQFATLEDWGREHVPDFASHACHVSRV